MSFLKNSQVQINFQLNEKKPYDHLSIILTGKNSRGGSAGRSFLKSFFVFEKTVFPYTNFVIVLRDIIGLENFPLSFNRIIIQNYYVIFALV